MALRREQELQETARYLENARQELSEAKKLLGIATYKQEEKVSLRIVATANRKPGNMLVNQCTNAFVTLRSHLFIAMALLEERRSCKGMRSRLDNAACLLIYLVSLSPFVKWVSYKSPASQEGQVSAKLSTSQMTW
jgi:hypothetical protein